MTTLIRRFPMSWTMRLALLRLSAQWRSLLTVAIGVLLAAAIGAAAPLYTAAIAQYGMVQRLNALPSNEANLTLRVGFSAGQSAESGGIDARLSALDQQVDTLIGGSLGGFPGWVNAIVRWGESGSLFVMRDGTELEGVKLAAAFYDDWPAHVTLVSGDLPDDSLDSGIDLEGVISAEAATTLNLNPGDTVTLDQRGWDTSRPITLKITGIVAERDSRSAYFMTPSPLRIERASAGIEANVLVTRESLLRISEQYLPDTGGSFGWRVLFDHQQFPYTQIPQAVEALDGLRLHSLETIEDALHLPLTYQTNIPAVLTAYAGEVGLLSAPFGLLLLQIGALVLFFLVVTVTLVRRGERREIAMLQSRGAFDQQIVIVRFFEGLAICITTAAIAPFLTRQFLVWMAPLVTNVNALPLVLDAAPFAYAFGAVLTALVVLILTLRPVLRLPLILAGGAALRGERQSWWQKYYLDLLLLVIGAAALLRMVGSNSALTQTVTGGAQADPLLLLAPAILFVALGSLSLRLFPAFADAAARLYTRQRGLAGALATWQLSREPAHYARVTFLLALAIGVGWFATSFQATLARSQADQAAYQVGTDVRFSERDANIGADRAQSTAIYQAMPEVEAVSTGLRFDGLNLAQGSTGIQQGTLLAVDPATLPPVTEWRPDLGTLPLPGSTTSPSTESLPGEGLSGERLPAAPARIGVWVRATTRSQTGVADDGEPIFDYFPLFDFPLSYLNFFVRLRDSSGTYFQIPLHAAAIEGAESVEEASYTLPVNASDMDQINAELERVRTLRASLSGWIYLEGTVEEPLTGDVWLDEVYFQAGELQPTTMQFGIDRATEDRYRRVTFADMSMTDAADQSHPLPLLGERWQLAEGSGLGSFGLLLHVAHSDRGTSQTFEWFQWQGTDTFGFMLNYPPRGPISALISSGYAEENNLPVGAVFELFINRQRLTFTVQDIIDHFPTLYADRTPFVVVARDDLLYSLNRRAGAGYYASEVWLKLHEGIAPDTFLERYRISAAADSHLIEPSLTRSDALRTLQTDPLALGLIGLLFIAFIVALTLSIVSLLTYTALTAQARRGEFAVLRALGMSSGRLMVSIAGEQLFVFVTAVGLGAVLGLLLSHQVLPSLAISTNGNAITPPFLVQIESSALLGYGVILMLVLALVLAGSMVLVRRLSLSQALRYGEE
ncbi:MAG: FtsX-like permease family protein [Anaerolineae bacterium]